VPIATRDDISASIVLSPFGEAAMAEQQSRRDFLTGAGAMGLVIASSGPRSMLPCASAQSAAPASAAGIEYQTVRQLVAALAAKRVSSAELTDHCIKRIEALDGKINAVVVRDFERARAAAREADAALARGERKPLLGLPMTVKESFNVAGLPTTWGFPDSNWPVSNDAVTVARLKAAGAVILGKTNVPVRLADWQSFNPVYGTTNNPWDLARTPGGSSGGGAAALAAGYVPLELGSDIGGSLRAPPHYCGVFGHKPTHSLVPSRGHVPPRAEPLPREPDLAVVGPMARSAADLALALDVLAGPDEPNAVAYRLALPPPRHADLKNFRVLVLDTHPLLPTANSVRTAIVRLSEQLARTGATVAHASPLLPDLTLMSRTFTYLLMAFMGADIPIEVYREVQGAVTAIPPDARGLGPERARGLVLSHRDWVRADRVRATANRQWRDLFREWDVVVCPVMPTPAFAHDHSEPQRMRQIEIDGAKYPYLDQIVWAGIANMTGLPATAVPVGRSETGLPIGVQIIGPYLEDRTTIAFAELIEREFGGFAPPPGYAG
jgi:amidase